MADAEAKTVASACWTIGSALVDSDTRPEMVAFGLCSLGAEKALAKIGFCEEDKASLVVEKIAQLSTLAGLIEKKAELSELAAPIIAKARDADGRKALAEELVATQLVQDGRVLAAAKVAAAKELAAPKVAAAKEFAAPKVAAAKEFAAPFVQSVKDSPYVAQLAELRRSERVEAMLAAFHAARERPEGAAEALRAKAVDLIKYETLASYREHVMSEQFAADTVRLVKVDLPALASAAAKKGAERLKTQATALAEDLDGYKARALAFVEATKERAPTSAKDLEALRARLRATGAALAAELQAEYAAGAAEFSASGFSAAETLERLRRVVGVVDKIVLSPLLAAAAGGSAPAASEAAAEIPAPAAPAAPTDDGGADAIDADEEMAEAPTDEDATAAAAGEVAEPTPGAANQHPWCVEAATEGSSAPAAPGPASQGEPSADEEMKDAVDDLD